MPVRFGSFAETISREARAITLPSPNLGAVTPSRQAETVAPSNANHRCNKVANKAPRRVSRPESSSVKFLLRSGAKGSSMGAESGIYAASALKGVTKVLSCEARTKALSSANHLFGDEKNEASSRASLSKPADAKSAPHKAIAKR